MRDRSWGIRAPRRQPKLGLLPRDRGPDSSFLSISDRPQRRRRRRRWLSHAGRGVGAPRRRAPDTVERDEQGRPAHVRVEAVDERGRPLEATGTTVSRQVFTAYPDMFCWNSLARWEFDGAVAWGEDQDIWHPRAWRDFAARSGGSRAMTAAVSDATADLVDWVRGVTGRVPLHIERRSGGGSREGYAVDVEAADGTTERAVVAHATRVQGRSRHGPYTLRREAAVYRQVAATRVKVATAGGRASDRRGVLDGAARRANWFAEVDRPGRAGAHRDGVHGAAGRPCIGSIVRDLDLPELGAGRYGRRARPATRSTSGRRSTGRTMSPSP